MAIHPHTPKKFVSRELRRKPKSFFQKCPDISSREGKPPPASELLNEGGNLFPSQTLTNDIKGIALENLSNPPKNTPSIAVGLDGDEFGIVGASPTINLVGPRLTDLM
jgi:hypothetical protein